MKWWRRRWLCNSPKEECNDNGSFRATLGKLIGGTHLLPHSGGVNYIGLGDLLY